jgi:lysophospholipase L1-like esterase
MKFDRIFCFGDSITLGCNDSEGLGWPGRLCRNLKHEEYSVAAYNLGVNGDTSLDIAARWRAETETRSRDVSGLILFSFGFNDAAKENGGDVQVDLTTSISVACTVLTEARSVSEVLWIGPTPLDESVNPMQTETACWDMRNADIARYDEAYADLALDIDVDYLRLFPEFLQSRRYQAALVAGDKVHPGDDGYAMIAERIAGWNKWLEKLQD